MSDSSPAMPDYSLRANSPPPTDYPSQPVPDGYSDRPFAPIYETRRQLFLDHIQRNPTTNNYAAPFYEVARLATNGTPHDGILHGALDYIDQRKDCSDFVLHAILRLLYQFREDPRLNPVLDRQARQTVVAFKYWPDEPGSDSMCYWTENHYILFSSAAYLAGQLFPEAVFTNSRQNGEEKMALNRPRILRWLDLRFQTGFSEWLSHIYYDEDLVALINLVDLCEDEEIRNRAAQIIDLLLLDMTLHSFKGVFGSTHGRSYAQSKKWAAQEGTIDTNKLLFGRGVFSGGNNMSAALLALSTRYQMPPVLYEISEYLNSHETVIRQRMGIRVDDGDQWGLGYKDLEDGMHWLTLEAYTHPHTINLFMEMLESFNWWQNEFFVDLSNRRGLLRTLRALKLLPRLAKLVERDITRNTREEVNIYTYRTPDYLLSTAQDYRPGYGGDQQQIWQATLWPDAVCFTTHPGRSSHDGLTPNYWTGSGALPRAAQVGNVVISIYNIITGPALYLPNRLLFTHAWLPRDQFDEVIESDGWIFARKGDGYLALRSQNDYQWQDSTGEDQDREIIVPGTQNIWLCELGCRTQDGDFDSFLGRILGSELIFEGLNVSYASPSQGLLEFGWQGPLRQNGEPVSLHDYPRYDGLVQAAFPSQKININHAKHTLSLDNRTGERFFT